MLGCEGCKGVSGGAGDTYTTRGTTRTHNAFMLLQCSTSLDKIYIQQWYMRIPGTLQDSREAVGRLGDESERGSPRAEGRHMYSLFYTPRSGGSSSRQKSSSIERGKFMHTVYARSSRHPGSTGPMLDAWPSLRSVATPPSLGQLSAIRSRKNE